MAKFYQGESSCIVMRFMEDDGVTPSDLTGKEISVIVRDSFGDIQCSYSTLSLENVGDIYIHENVLLCKLLKTDTYTFEGYYTIEVKITEEDMVSIGICKKIKISPSVIGKELEL